MPNASSPLGTTQDYIPFIHPAHVAKAAGLLMMLPDVAALGAAVSAHGAMWPDSQIVFVATEFAAAMCCRVWKSGPGHARTVVLRPGLSVVLASDANQVIAAAGAPDAGAGSDGDVAVDWAGNAYYTKVAGAWSASGALHQGGGSGGLPSPQFRAEALNGDEYTVNLGVQTSDPLNQQAAVVVAPSLAQYFGDESSAIQLTASQGSNGEGTVGFLMYAYSSADQRCAPQIFSEAWGNTAYTRYASSQYDMGEIAIGGGVFRIRAFNPYAGELTHIELGTRDHASGDTGDARIYTGPPDYGRSGNITLKTGKPVYSGAPGGISLAVPQRLSEFDEVGNITIRAGSDSPDFPGFTALNGSVGIQSDFGKVVITAAAGEVNLHSGGTYGDLNATAQRDVNIEAGKTVAIRSANCLVSLQNAGSAGAFEIAAQPGKSVYVGTSGLNGNIFLQASDGGKVMISGPTVIGGIPSGPVALGSNSQMTFSMPSNAVLRLSVRGNDGVTRYADLPLTA